MCVVSERDSGRECAHQWAGVCEGEIDSECNLHAHLLIPCPRLRVLGAWVMMLVEVEDQVAYGCV
jgi:hypothetical protein